MQTVDGVRDFPQLMQEGVMIQLNSDQSQKLLVEMSKRLRQLRELNHIWQQTVNSLGPALEVSRCIICPYTTPSHLVSVTAEYLQEPYESMLGLQLTVEDHPHWKEAIASLEPVVVEKVQPNDQDQRQSMLVVAISYQDQPKGLISLYQCDYPRQWNAEEIELVREIAAQVGYCMAHASLYQELESARQQAQEAKRVQSHFLSTISDEIRNPLNAIIGSLQLILDDIVDDPAQQREFIQDAHHSALGLFNIINDILHFAQIKAGKMQLELGKPVNLGKLLSDVERFTRPPALHKHLYLTIQIPAHSEEIILYGNYWRLLQVMLNLAGNAIKFTHSGGVIISAEVYREKVTIHNQEWPGMVEVRVIDTGIGVPVEYLSRVFEPFFQVHECYTSPYPGTGLGLSISKKLVEAMGGGINFYSMGEGMGSTVIFSVPLYQEPLMSSPPLTD